ncbi:MAG: APC family permease [Sphingomonadaceae bacterium]
MARGNSDRNGNNGEEGSGDALARSISPPLLAMYGIGTVLGAGIYVVIGKIIGEAGALAPFAFLFAAAAAALTAFSYAELSVRVPQSGGSEAFVARAFDTRPVTLAVGWAVIATGLVSAATIATGFVGYLGVFMSVSKWWAVPAMVGVLTFVAAIGAKQSAWFMGATTAAGIVGLLIVNFAAFGNLADYPARMSDAFASGGGWTMPVLLGSFLAFYAFIGFEDLVTLAEEAKDADRALPLAIFCALGVSLVFYLVTAAVAVSTLDREALQTSAAPLVDVVRAEGRSGTLLGILSLAIIVNSALAQIIMGARVTYDLGERRRGAPSWLARLDPRTQTPLIATLAAGAVVTALALFFPTETLAKGTSFIIFGVFLVANAALLKIKHDEEEPPEDCPVYPTLVPLGGLLVSAALLVAQIMFGGGEA